VWLRWNMRVGAHLQVATRRVHSTQTSQNSGGAWRNTGTWSRTLRTVRNGRPSEARWAMAKVSEPGVEQWPACEERSTGEPICVGLNMEVDHLTSYLGHLKTDSRFEHVQVTIACAIS
jgi:hypothetical protein